MTRRDYCGLCNETVGDDGPTCGSCGISFHYECTRYKTIEGFYSLMFKELDDYCIKPCVNNNRIDFETFMAIDSYEYNASGSGLDEDEISDIFDYKIEILDYFQCDNCHENDNEISKKKFRNFKA